MLDICNNRANRLTQNDTYVIKGIAIILMLLHHLFYVRRELYDDFILYGNHGIVNEIGIFSKVCVAIFVFLSGYGLTVSNGNNKKISLKDFYAHRFVKLYMNYWLIWLLFVPLSVYCFGRTFDVVYGSHIIPKLVADLFGVINVFGLYGYNPTWWFYSAIIVLWLLYPLFLRLSKYPAFLLILGVVCYFSPVRMTIGISSYVLPFVVGILYAKIEFATPEFTPPYCKHFDKQSAGTWINRTTLIFAILAIAMVLFIERIVAHDKILYDTLITVVLVLGYKKLRFPAWLSNALEYLGRHSMNIFLFHTFVFLYWFKDFVYYSRNPLLIFFSLLFICLMLSYMIERIKDLLHFNSIVAWIETRIRKCV